MVPRTWRLKPTILTADCSDWLAEWEVVTAALKTNTSLWDMMRCSSEKRAASGPNLGGGGTATVAPEPPANRNRIRRFCWGFISQNYEILVCNFRLLSLLKNQKMLARLPCCLYVCVFSSIVVRQRLRKHNPAATNTNATIKELLYAVFSMLSVSYQILSM
jgi:hypothetical protein